MIVEAVIISNTDGEEMIDVLIVGGNGRSIMVKFNTISGVSIKVVYLLRTWILYEFLHTKFILPDA